MTYLNEKIEDALNRVWKLRNNLNKEKISNQDIILLGLKKLEEEYATNRN